jgi:hypothetical protein
MELDPCLALRLSVVHVCGGGLLLVEASNSDPLNGLNLQVSYTLLVRPLAVCGLYRLSLFEGNRSSRTPRLTCLAVTASGPLGSFDIYIHMSQ